MALLQISEVLTAEDLAKVREALPQLSWRDGKVTAGKTARQVKDNEQADLTSGDGQALRALLHDAVAKNIIVRTAARPRRLSQIMVSKTSNGGRYGRHVDNALMQIGSSRMRTDLSFTLFLSEPEAYEGGELVMHSATGSQGIKLGKGDLVLYPSSDIHEVTPVTSGERIVAVGWIESLVPYERQRDLLFDLENLRASMRSAYEAGSEELLTLDKSIADLLRMWSRP